MNTERKAAWLNQGRLLATLLITILLSHCSNNRYRAEIPELGNFNSLPKYEQTQINKALNLAKEKPTPHNLGKLGMVYHSGANYPEAEKSYKLAVQRSKSEWKWNYYLGYLNMEMGNSGEVVANFKKVVEMKPGMHLAWYYLGEEYRNKGDNKKAEDAFNKLSGINTIPAPNKNTTRTDNFPLGIYAKFQLARIYIDTGQIDLAEKILKGIAGEWRSFGSAYRLLATIYNLKGNQQLSKWYSDKAGDLVNFSPPVDTLIDRLVLLSRSELYLLKKIDEAQNSIYSDWTLKLINNALEHIPDNKYLYSKAVKIYLWKGQYDKAISLTGKHIDYFKEDFNEMNRFGMYFYKKRLYGEALKYWHIASELHPSNIEIRKNIAICFWGTGKKQQAHKLLESIYAGIKNNPGDRAKLADLYFHLGGKRKATAYLNQLEKIIPSDPYVLKLQGEIAQAQGNFSEAISLYEASIEGNPEELATIRYLGNLLFKQGLWAKYISHYRKALEYHPNEPEFLERLGLALLECPEKQLRDINEAKKYLERAYINLSGGRQTLISSGRGLALAYAMLGDKKNAISFMKQTIIHSKRSNMPEGYIENLRKMLKTFEAM